MRFEIRGIAKTQLLTVNMQSNRDSGNKPRLLAAKMQSNRGSGNPRNSITCCEKCNWIEIRGIPETQLLPVEMQSKDLQAESWNLIPLHIMLLLDKFWLFEIRWLNHLINGMQSILRGTKNNPSKNQSEKCLWTPQAKAICTSLHPTRFLSEIPRIHNFNFIEETATHRMKTCVRDKVIDHSLHWKQKTVIVQVLVLDRHTKHETSLNNNVSC